MSSNLLTAVIVSDTSIKKHIIISIAHIHVHGNPIIKTIYHTINIMSTEAELFTIRYGINQATYLLNIKRIVIILYFFHATKRIFDSSIHLYQIYLTAILYELREFFKRNTDNSIKFWDCPSHYNWGSHSIINKEIKSFNSISNLSCKSS